LEFLVQKSVAKSACDFKRCRALTHGDPTATVGAGVHNLAYVGANSVVFIVILRPWF
jgi:hypothetical protein